MTAIQTEPPTALNNPRKSKNNIDYKQTIMESKGAHYNVFIEQIYDEVKGGTVEQAGYNLSCVQRAARHAFVALQAAC